MIKAYDPYIYSYYCMIFGSILLFLPIILGAIIYIIYGIKNIIKIIMKQYDIVIFNGSNESEQQDIPDDEELVIDMDYDNTEN